MTLLLKNVWRNVLKNRPLSNSTIRSSLSSSISELAVTKPSDALMISIKSAPSTAEVLAAVQNNIGSLTHRHMLQALRTIFELQKSNSNDPEMLIKDPGFSVLCQNFKKHVRALEVNETIEAIKVLSYLKVPVDSLLVQTLLQLVRYNINMISVRQIMFLDFILSRFDTKNHLVDALRLALPLAFQIHLPLELDNQDLPLLRDMLMYSCSHDLPDRCINNIVTGLLLHDQAIDAHIARSIIWSLCDVNCTEKVFPTRVQLLHICCDILSERINKLSYEDVLRTAAKLKGRILEKHPEYYHQELMDSIAGYVINNNVPFENSLLVARVLSRIAHTNLSLIEYLCFQVASNPHTLTNARTNILFGFINCLANNNYIPSGDEWTEIKAQISRNPILSANSTALPWTKVCLELASLGVYEERLLKKVFSKEFLEKYLAREKNDLDYLQLLTLHEAVHTFHSEHYTLPNEVLQRARNSYPVHAVSEELETYLVRGLGSPEYAVRNVMLPCGIVADVVLCLKNGLPLKLPPLSSELKVPLEKLNIPPGAVVICIMNFNYGCFSMNSHRLRGTFRLIIDILEKQGYWTVAFNINEWMNAPAHERTPYIMREINYRCGEIGMKLTAT
ncbi:uncharacterized protein LOC111003942 isoform X2 [Pieris rapae]|nr:uncharacterized protein LOC111003942 isoform X2 [Pieris rapae]XP_022130413.1 uncharacterized protein LOC111003942 isoform X2 [Pieris rapae]XP_022130414.1 uncharacterized protein LOC111003942 isoform X2 [Pieris rapae]